MNIQYGDLTIIKKTDIEFFPGVTCIIGRSGTGKSSLLNALLEEEKAIVTDNLLR